MFASTIVPSNILAEVTASSAIVKDVDPVTSPVCVALVTLFELSDIAELTAVDNLAESTAPPAISLVPTAFAGILPDVMASSSTPSVDIFVNAT